MKISLVMATYNGEKFLLEQLESIRNQTKMPDEVLIVDDKSIDKTVEISQKFIESYQLKNWSVHINQRNKGYARNFMDGIEATTGDLVFFCDQDDIWNQNKIQQISRIFEDEDVLVVDSDYTPYVTPDMDSLSKIFYWLEDKKMKDNGKVSISGFESFGLFSGRPGWTMAVRKSFYDEVKSYFTSGFSHDRFIGGIAALNDGLYHLSSKTGKFRRWPSSSTAFSGKKVSLTEKEIKVSKQYERRTEVFMNYLSEHRDIKHKENKYKLLKQQREYLINRAHFLESRKFVDYIQTQRHAKKNKYGLDIEGFIYSFKDIKIN